MTVLAVFAVFDVGLILTVSGILLKIPLLLWLGILIIGVTLAGVFGWTLGELDIVSALLVAFVMYPFYAVAMPVVALVEGVGVIAHYTFRRLQAQ